MLVQNPLEPVTRKKYDIVAKTEKIIYSFRFISECVWPSCADNWWRWWSRTAFGFELCPVEGKSRDLGHKS